MTRVAIHLIWAGAMMTAVSKVAIAAVAIWGREGGPDVTGHLLSIAGPLTGMLGVLFSFAERRHPKPPPPT